MPHLIRRFTCCCLVLLGAKGTEVAGQSADGPPSVAQHRVDLESGLRDLSNAEVFHESDWSAEDSAEDSAGDSAEESDQDRLRRFQIDLETVRRTYSSWGVLRQTRIYATLTAGPGEDTENEDTENTARWSTEMPIETLSERFLKSDGQFRSDCLEPPLLRRVFAFDGVTGRIRDTNRLQNGPMLNLTAAHENDFTIQLPHTALVDYFYAPNLSPIFSMTDGQAMNNASGLPSRLKVGQEEIDGHPCWELTFRTVSEEDGRAIILCNVFLAQDRGMLPIRQIYQASYGSLLGEVTVIRTEEFQTDPSSGLWYPKEVTGLQRVSNLAKLTRFSFQISELHNEPALFSKAQAIAPAHAKPPKVVVAQHVPFPVLTDLPGPGSNSTTVTNSYRRKIAGGGVIVLALIFTAISLCLRTTRLGRILRDLVGRHRTIMGVTGMIATACAGLLASYPPGWTNNGLAMMAAGLFGTGWIGLSMLFTGDKQVSIKMALFAAACAAIFFGGYSMGIKRMQVRQQMIREIRDQGGQVVMGRWHLDEDGLFLPKSMRHLLGEAWSGRANRAAISAESFTKESVENWCLDEVQWLGIASQQDAPFRVDSDVLAKIDATDALWTFHAEGGYLDDAAFRELSRFDRLIDIYCDCQHRGISPEIARMPKLERLWLTHAIIDQAFFQTLREVSELEYITLIQPRIGSINAPVPELGLKGIEIRNANLSPRDLNAIGNLPLDLVFVDCSFNLPPSDNVSLAVTKTLAFKASDLTNQSLLKLTESPQLRGIQLAGTNVSQEGIEAFTNVRPKVLLTME
jgi:hypothetical protein